MPQYNRNDLEIAARNQHFIYLLRGTFIIPETGLIYCWKCRIKQCFLKTKSVSDHSASRLQTVISTVLPRMLIFTLSASLLRIERS